ncbi:hypothetical protein SHKM778_85500 [Streptomyces sp. KM77-8]|uniref:Orn/DAP/Arg decarboxylase 2 N-terminal domain-containing protein n=1 Tax=Streptomyces haneummycinicus TaxID=3074435 RepID=A0AAT9HXP8_9ACTN
MAGFMRTDMDDAQGTGDAVAHDGARTDEVDPYAGGRAARRDEAVRAAVRQGLLDDGNPLVGLLDVTGIRESAAELRAAFDAVTAPGTPVLHAFAVKASPLVPVLRLLREEGIGAEVASPGELALARAAGWSRSVRFSTRRRRRPRSCGRRSRWASPSTRTIRRNWPVSTP